MGANRIGKMYFCGEKMALYQDMSFSTKIGYIEPNEPIMILKKGHLDAWAYVLYQNKVGWISLVFKNLIWMDDYRVG